MKTAIQPPRSGPAIVLREGARGPGVDGRAAPQAAGEIDQVDGEIVEREQRELLGERGQDRGKPHVRQ